MGLEEAYKRALQAELQRQQASSRSQKQMEEEKYRSLCAGIPALQKMYEEQGSWGFRSYTKIYKGTLTTQLPPNMQSIINDFIRMCPQTAWEFSPSTYGKYILADKSIHIIYGGSKSERALQYGSQHWLDLPYGVDRGEDCHGETAWEGHSLILFQDGFVGADNSGPVLKGEKALSDFCAEQLVAFKLYGKFRYIYYSKS